MKNKLVTHPLSLCPLLPSSSTPSIPFHPLPVLSWSEILKEQKALPVCSGIMVCDFSLTSKAALWHGGVIVIDGW